jgi:plasmid stability protein
MGALLMKTTLELPDALMRAVRVRAAATDRRIKDVMAEAIAAGLAASGDSAPSGTETGMQTPGGVRHATRRAAKLDPALEALFAEGDAMAAPGVNFETWAARSRDVWR